MFVEGDRLRHRLGGVDQPKEITRSGRGIYPRVYLKARPQASGDKSLFPTL